MAKATCSAKKKIQIVNKRGVVVAEFQGRQGAGCPPRKKPSTAHLRVYKTAMTEAAKTCEGNKGAEFRRCVGGAIKSMTAPATGERSTKASRAAARAALRKKNKKKK